MTEERGRRGRPSAADALARDERVITVAVTLLVSEGFDALTFDRVAAEAGVAKRTLYSVFGDRAGLVRAATRRQHAYEDADRDADHDLRSACRTVAARLLGDEAVGIHRAVLAAADPALAEEFYREGPERAQAFLARHLPAESDVSAVLLFAALLGEPHRRRLLRLADAPTPDEIAAHVDAVLDALRLLRAG